MTGPEHYRAAEGMLASVNSPNTDRYSVNTEVARQMISEAQVHATLALAAAALGLDDSDNWPEVTR